MSTDDEVKTTCPDDGWYQDKCPRCLGAKAMVEHRETRFSRGRWLVPCWKCKGTGIVTRQIGA